jgi:hypothetical protein
LRITRRLENGNGAAFVKLSSSVDYFEAGGDKPEISRSVCLGKREARIREDTKRA